MEGKAKDPQSPGTNFARQFSIELDGQILDLKQFFDKIQKIRQSTESVKQEQIALTRDLNQLNGLKSMDVDSLIGNLANAYDEMIGKFDKLSPNKSGQLKAPIQAIKAVRELYEELEPVRKVIPPGTNEYFDNLMTTVENTLTRIDKANNMAGSKGIIGAMTGNMTVVPEKQLENLQ